MPAKVVKERDGKLIFSSLQACSDLCRGEYTAQSDKIKSLFSCAVWTAPTLACIAVGVGKNLDKCFHYQDVSISKERGYKKHGRQLVLLFLPFLQQ